MKISILGCGWLGQPLGSRLVKEGETVLGSTTRLKRIDLLRQEGIQPFLIDTAERIDTMDNKPFWESDLLLLNIPPGRSRNDVLTRHPEEIATVKQCIDGGDIKRVIFVSSTSVYAPFGGLKREEDAGREPASSQSGEALLEAERILSDSSQYETTILRLAGLYGYDRHPAKNLSGRKNLTDGDKPVNLIHRDDAIEILIRLIHSGLVDEVFNGVSDGHPTRREFYCAMAREIGLVEPHFLDEKQQKDWKVISNEKLKKTLPYHFRYPDPTDPAP